MLKKQTNICVLLYLFVLFEVFQVDVEVVGIVKNIVTKIKYTYTVFILGYQYWEATNKW